MKYFVHEDSIVREIWRKTDTVLLIFGGAAAEFALNKAVDWLYFTGKLPKDPIGRLFSTVAYAQKIIFEEEQKVNTVLKAINTVHQNVELARGYAIPDWAYRDVLFMLIHYSIASYELVERKLSTDEKEAIFEVFGRLGAALNLKNLPQTYEEWLVARDEHLDQNLAFSSFSKDLLAQYKKHLGAFRYTILVEGQKLLVPPQVAKLMGFSSPKPFKMVVWAYKRTKKYSLAQRFKLALLPAKYR